MPIFALEIKTKDIMETIVKLKTNRSDYDIRMSAERTLTIGELIDALSLYPKDTKVVFSNDGGYTYGDIGYCDVEWCEVESIAEQEEREKREREEDENTTLHCPNCDSDNICWSVNGGYSCLDCAKKFKKPIVKIYGQISQ